MKARRVLETCLYVNNLEAAERFYCRVLGLEVYAREAGRHVFFRLEQGMFLLFDPEGVERSGGRFDVPTHGARGAGHAAFAMEAREVDAWREHLAREGVAVESEVEWPNGGRSLYFRDPAGNSLELATPAMWGMAG